MQQEIFKDDSKAFIWVTENKPYHASLLGYLHENKTYVEELSSQTDDNEQQKVEGFCWKNG